MSGLKFHVAERDHGREKSINNKQMRPVFDQY